MLIKSPVKGVCKEIKQEQISENLPTLIINYKICSHIYKDSLAHVKLRCCVLVTALLFKLIHRDNVIAQYYYGNVML